MTDAKITQLEEIITHQEQQINTLSEMVARQWDEIDLLKKRVKKIQETVIGLADKDARSAVDQKANDKPPHY